LPYIFQYHVTNQCDTLVSIGIPMEHDMAQDDVPTTLAPAQVAYSVEKFVRTFNIGRSTIYEEIRSGRLKIRKAGARTLIPHEDAMAWLNGLPTQSVDRTKDISCLAKSTETVFHGSNAPAPGSGTQLPSGRAEQDWEGQREAVVETLRKVEHYRRAAEPGHEK
jgi:hypothetical protein